MFEILIIIFSNKSHVINEVHQSTPLEKALLALIYHRACIYPQRYVVISSPLGCRLDHR